MKKIILSPVLLFLLACNNNPTETNNSPLSNNINRDYVAWAKRWAKEELTNTVAGETVNFTDANNLKQGKWVILTAKGKMIKTQYYKDGRLVQNDGC